MTSADWVVIGRFGRPHGLKGFITVHSFTEERDAILQYIPWYTLERGIGTRVPLLQTEVNDKHILVQIEGMSEREDIARYTNKDIVIERAQLPVLPEDDFYWHELTGMQVINTEGIDFGQVTDMMSTGANDVMVVTGDKRRLIPYLLDRVVLSISREKRQIRVDWDADF